MNDEVKEEGCIPGNNAKYGQLVNGNMTLTLGNTAKSSKYKSNSLRKQEQD